MRRVRNLQQPSAAASAVAKGVPPPSCTAIGASEVQRFYEIVQPPSQEQSDRRAELKRLSDERVANWPNTIEASRSKKQSTRQSRLEEEERRRVIIDEEEKALQIAKKEALINRANQMLYEQNDRIKNFTSKLFLASVLDEREKQLAIREEKQELEQQVDMHWAMVEREARLKAEEKEAEKLKTLKDRSMKLKEAQLEQLAAIRDIKIAARDARVKEGLEIRQRTIEAAKKQEEDEKKRKKENFERSRKLAKQNKEHKEERERIALQEKMEEEARMAEFARNKEQQTEELKKRVEEKFRAKLTRRQRLIDHQSEKLMEFLSQREEQEMKAMRDFERERGEREAREAASRAAREDEIAKFRADHKLRQEIAARKEAAEKARMVEIWRDRAELLINEEIEERKQAREEAERLQQFHMLQLHEKQQQTTAEKKSELMEGIYLQNALKEEQDAYHAYVNAVMSDYVRHGRAAEIVKNAAKRSKNVEAPPA